MLLYCGLFKLVLSCGMQWTARCVCVVMYCTEWTVKVRADQVVLSCNVI